MGKRSRDCLGDSSAQAYTGEKTKKRRKDGDGSEKKKSKRLRELKKDIVDLPEDDKEELAEESVVGRISADANGEGEALSKKAEKKRRKKELAERELKNGAGHEVEEQLVQGQDDENEGNPIEGKKSKKNKKKKKTKDAANEEEGGVKVTNQEEPKANMATKEAGGVEEDGDESLTQGKAPRFIVFVGNLPYSATAESIGAHFASLNPAQVRCLTKRDDPTKCRGCAFIDFTSSKDMRTCLDKMHHSTFNDGISKPRKINVELTAGGGGKTSNRMDKIKRKNEKLNANRLKRIEQEKEEKKHKAKETNGNGGAEDSMHPSRRARLPGV
ncbi:hypothetical protein jhhlp_003984 [Lomentospora prolificans]|uniref:RRM domain-containing protein n=1 Tax=Lomentospora prolificans TaxID=41688 RepID=A0A2N3NAA6_9PEZI|nr:hypothetical protein jhhlp_003984 [Lomentospora prolificans]